MLRSRTLAVTGMLSTSLAVALPAFAEDREANSSTLVDKEFEVIRWVAASAVARCCSRQRQWT